MPCRGIILIGSDNPPKVLSKVRRDYKGGYLYTMTYKWGDVHSRTTNTTEFATSNAEAQMANTYRIIRAGSIHSGEEYHSIVSSCLSDTCFLNREPKVSVHGVPKEVGDTALQYARARGAGDFATSDMLREKLRNENFYWVRDSGDPGSVEGAIVENVSYVDMSEYDAIPWEIV